MLLRSSLHAEDYPPPPPQTSAPLQLSLMIAGPLNSTVTRNWRREDFGRRVSYRSEMNLSFLFIYLIGMMNIFPSQYAITL
jgi:hypothetical protein